MIAVILAGGKGTRFGSLTKSIPKPMIKIGNKPIIWHILKSLSLRGINNFLICTGYKEKIIRDYLSKLKENWSIKCVYTGLNTKTARRIGLVSKYIKEDKFLMTYGDGLSNVDINKLIKFHKKNNKLVTLTSVRPPARFGAIKIMKNYVKYFREKNSLDEGWINGGFFVIEPKFLKFINGDNTFMEQEPLKKISKKKQLVAFKHYGFWQCMDTLRDKEILEKKIKNKEHLETK